MKRLLTLLSISVLFGCGSGPTTQASESKPTAIENNETLTTIAPLLSTAEADKPHLAQTFQLPIYGQTLSLSSLTGEAWKKVSEETIPSYRAKFIPESENETDWQNQLTIQAFEQMATSEDKIAAIKLFHMALKANQEKSCPKGKFVYEALKRDQTDRKNRKDFIMGCLVEPNFQTTQTKGEVSYYVFLAGKMDLYLIQKSIQGSESYLSETLTADTATAFIGDLEPIQLLD